MTDRERPSMMDWWELSHNRYGEERTPGGSPRFKFYFGVRNEAFFLWKFKVWRPIDEAPACIIVSFEPRDFVQAAKEVGLHISNKEKRELLKELHEAETAQGD